MTNWLNLEEAAKVLGITPKDVRRHADAGTIEWRQGPGGKEVAERDFWRINPPIIVPQALPPAHVTVRQVHQHLEQWLAAGTGDPGVAEFVMEVIWEAATIVSPDLYVLSNDSSVVLRATPQGRNGWEFAKALGGEIVVTVDFGGAFLIGRGTLGEALAQVNAKASCCGVDVSQLFRQPD